MRMVGRLDLDLSRRALEDLAGEQLEYLIAERGLDDDETLLADVATDEPPVFFGCQEIQKLFLIGGLFSGMGMFVLESCRFLLELPDPSGLIQDLCFEQRIVGRGVERHCANLAPH